MKAPSNIDDSHYIGREYAEVFKELVEDKKTKFRISRMDDARYLLTADLNFRRLNFEVDKGIVTKVTRG